MVLIDIIWLKQMAVLVLFFPTSWRSSPKHSFSCLFISIGEMYTDLPFLQLKLFAQVEQRKGWFPTSKKDAADILCRFSLQLLYCDRFHFQLSPRAFPVAGEDATELHCVGENHSFPQTGTARLGPVQKFSWIELHQMGMQAVGG